LVPRPLQIVSISINLFYSFLNFFSKLFFSSQPQLQTDHRQPLQIPNTDIQLHIDSIPINIAVQSTNDNDFITSSAAVAAAAAAAATASSSSNQNNHLSYNQNLRQTRLGFRTQLGIPTSDIFTGIGINNTILLTRHQQQQQPQQQQQ
jgi:hypothetical protein